jgi:simple sugar transport system ATP-binding protein
MQGDYILEMQAITKVFPGVIANDHISIDLKYGEVHALLGENGAGKSTLMNILSGISHPDEGKILLEGNEVRIESPKDAIRKGIGMVYQHFMLIPQLTVVENIILGMKQPHEPKLDRKGASEKISGFAKRYGMDVDPSLPVWQLSVGQQQRVEIIKALYRGAKILVLDEPTAVLTPQETDELFHMIRNYTDENYAVIFISHKIDEVLEISDRITVLRRGKKMGTVCNADISKGDLAKMMVGHDVSFCVDKAPSTPGKPILQLQDVEAVGVKGLPALKKISFTLCKGEILGVAGVDGNGQSELVEVITGLRNVKSGTISIDGVDVTNQSARTILSHSVGHIPEDRQKRGLILDMDLTENLILHDYYTKPHTKRAFLDWHYIHGHALGLIDEYDVRTPSPRVMAKNLSGGNQQKLILARELHRKPQLLIAMHSTRGLDVGAIEYVHRKMVEQRDGGTGVLYVSTEIDEILSLCDRILVMSHGKKMGIVRPDEVTIEELGLMMAGSLECGDSGH